MSPDSDTYTWGAFSPAHFHPSEATTPQAESSKSCLSDAPFIPHGGFALVDSCSCLSKKYNCVALKSTPQNESDPKLRPSAPATTSRINMQTVISHTVFPGITTPCTAFKQYVCVFKTEAPTAKDTSDVSSHSKWFVQKHMLGLK